jgi:HK97 family phage portal protein
MSLLRKEVRALPLSIDPYQISARPSFANYSGEIVNEGNALTSTPVLAAVTLLADSIATMPLELSKDIGGRWEQLPTPPVFVRPNSEQMMFEFVHQTVATLAVHGVAFIYAPRKGLLPLEMRNIHPDKVMVTLDDEGNVLYKVGKDLFTGDVIQQINWLRYPNQLRGYSPLELLRNLIGTDISITRFLSAWYGDGGTPSSVIETETQLTSEQAQVLRDTWVDTHYKRRQPAVLTGGLKWKSIQASAADMDTMAHREQLVREVARAYRIPLHLISGTGGDSQTYQNVESAGIQFVRHTLMPWMRRLEDSFSAMLPAQQRIRFNADDMMRADLATRVRSHQVQIASGTLTPNEARYIEEREPYVGGDEFVLNLPGAPMAGTVDAPPLGTDSKTIN